MPDSTRIQVKLNPTDSYRTVITDTSPYEVPIIFSNDGFYTNLNTHQKKSEILNQLLNCLLFKDRKFTIPLSYNIVKSTDSVRTLSLVHPWSQVSTASFYDTYQQLICEFAERSPFSIRKASKVGKSYFFNSNISDKNKYKKQSIDITGIDSLIRNPASYFTYSGVDRLYLFFLSGDYVNLEKKYTYQLSLDIGKCFDSIYTHSIAWATSTKRIAKNFTSSTTFGNQFDKLMQKQNYNETSGICIGPEVSRIFAEIILGKIDQNLSERLSFHGLKSNKEYACRRYVDNYYIFSNSEETLSKIQHELSLALSEYKLHLNQGKTELLKRPFYSAMSLVIDNTRGSLYKLWGQIIDTTYDDNGRRTEFPKHIRKHHKLFGEFTREIKAACFNSGMGYDSVSNYLIGAIKNKAVQLADTYLEAKNIGGERFNTIHYRENMLLLLDLSFYFFTLHPTVSASLRLSHSIVRIGQHLEKHDTEGFDITKEAILRWTSVLTQSPAFSKLYEKNAIVPVEILNVLISLKQFSSDGSLEAEVLDKMNIQNSDDNYFQIIVRLFIYADNELLQGKRDAVFKQACEMILQTPDIPLDSEATHLLLDLLSCKFITRQKREKLLRDAWPRLLQFDNSMGQITISQAAEVIEEIQQQHWFTRWNGVDLLNMIEKKELSEVYA